MLAKIYNKLSSIKNKELFLLLFCLISGGLISLMRGQVTNDFDTYNYHIYAPWAFLHNRYDIDILPCGIRSYFNPILDLPYYFLYKVFWSFPKIAGFIQGFWYGGVVFLGYKLSTLFYFENKADKFSFNILCLILTATSPVVLLLCGMVSTDLHITLFILLILYFYLQIIFSNEFNKKKTIFTGILIGAVVGLKLTSFVMISGILFASVFMLKQIKNPLKIFIYTFCSSIIGFLTINGYWYYKIWNTFKNPFFPYFNNLFQSPFGSYETIIQDSYTHVYLSNFISKLFYPLTTFFSKNAEGFGSWMFFYRDIRIPLIFMTIIFFGIKNFLSDKFKNNKNKNIINFLILFIILAYILWINIFPVARFIIPLFIVGNILFAYALFELISSFKIPKLNNTILKLSIICITTIIILFNTKIDLKNSAKPFEKTIFPNINQNLEKNSIIILASQTLSYIIPQLGTDYKYTYLIMPQQIDVSQIGYNFYRGTRTVDYYYSEYYENLLANILNKNETLYLLYRTSYSKEYSLYSDSLSYYINDRIDLTCTPIAEDLNLCKIYKFRD